MCWVSLGVAAPQGSCFHVLTWKAQNGTPCRYVVKNCHLTVGQLSPLSHHHGFFSSPFDCWEVCRHSAAAAKLLQSCPTLCDPIDGSPPGSPVPGILQARTLEWVAIYALVGLKDSWFGSWTVILGFLPTLTHHPIRWHVGCNLWGVLSATPLAGLDWGGGWSHMGLFQGNLGFG